MIDFSGFNIAIPLCVLSLVFLVLVYGAALNSTDIEDKGGLAVGWYSLLALRRIYFGLAIAVVIAAFTTSSFIAMCAFFGYQGYYLRHTDLRRMGLEFRRQTPDIIVVLLLAVLLSVNVWGFGASVSADDGTAHYSIVRKLYEGHKYLLAATHLMHADAGVKSNFYYYPFLNHVFVAKLYNFYQYTSISLPSFLAAAIISLVVLGLLSIAAFIAPYKGRYGAVTLLTLFVLGSVLGNVWQYSYSHGGGFRGFTCCFVFSASLLLLKHVREKREDYFCELALLLLASFLMHLQAFLICGFFATYIFLFHPELRKKTVQAIAIISIILLVIIKMHNSILGNLSGDSQNLFKNLTSMEIKNGELHALYVYVFVHGLDHADKYLGPFFLGLLCWHFFKGKKFVVDSNLLAKMTVIIFVIVWLLLTLLSDRILPYVLIPFTGGNARLSEFMGPFILILFVTYALEYLPPILLVSLLAFHGYFAIGNLIAVERTAQSYQTLSYVEFAAAKKALPDGKIVVFPGERRYEVLGAVSPESISSISYFDCPMPGNFQFQNCHRALNQGFALEECLMNDELLNQIKLDYPDRGYYFVTSARWGHSPACQSMKERYFDEVLNSADLLIYRIKS